MAPTRRRKPEDDVDLEDNVSPPSPSSSPSFISWAFYFEAMREMTWN